jgi:hypothetical protein
MIFSCAFRKISGTGVAQSVQRLGYGLDDGPPAQWVTGVLTPGVKWPGSESDHSPQSSAEVKNACSYTSILQHVFMA